MTTRAQPLNFGVDDWFFTEDVAKFTFELYEDSAGTPVDGTGYDVEWRICIDQEASTVVLGTIDATEEASGRWQVLWDSTGQPIGTHPHQFRVRPPGEGWRTYHSGVIQIRELC